MISSFQRILVITQLCLAFSLLLWYVMHPFMGEYFSLRSRMLLYEFVMGKGEGHEPGKSERQLQRFCTLSREDRKWIKQDYQQLQEYTQRPIYQKIAAGIRLWIHRIPPFEQAWIFFSILLSTLILLKIEGARQGAWLLPIIALAYLVDNQLTGQTLPPPPDHQLFPQESLLIKDFVNDPFSSEISTQKIQLEKGWRQYLIKNWVFFEKGNEQLQLEEAEFNFTVARLKLLHSQELFKWLHFYHEKLSFFSVCFYLLWNGLFAMILDSPFNKTRRIRWAYE